MKFRKKPIVVEAIQWLVYNYPDVVRFAEETNQTVRLDRDTFREYSEVGLMVDTLEGMVIASPGDWIIRGVHGELYPCKPDIFEETYEEAADKHFADDGKMFPLIENLIERMQKNADDLRAAEKEHYGRDSTVSTFTWMHSMKRDYEKFVEELDKIVNAIEETTEVQS